MKVLCSYCRKFYAEKEPLDDDRISHGMCNGCYADFERQFKGLPLDEYLDEFASPVLIVNEDGRIAAANRRARDMLGRSEREITGLLGGEAMECCYARLPDGCGKTVHCETCTIRNTVLNTIKTGTGIKKAPVKLMQDGVEREMVVSTCCVNGLVKIVIETSDEQLCRQIERIEVLSGDI